MKRSSIQQLKLRTMCKMSKTWTLGPRVSRRESRAINDERYDRRAVRPGENPNGFITVAKPTERRPSFLGASWTFVTVDPGEVLWGTGAQEGLIGKQQLDKWCKLIENHGLQVEWSQEKPESASGIGGETQPVGVVYVPVGLAGCNGFIRFTVVEGCPTSTASGIMMTLQASLDLTDDGDKVIFRQYGGESSLRILQSGHSVIRVDQFDPGGWQISRNWVRTMVKDAQQITCQSSLKCTRDPDAWTTIHQQETMTQHLHAVADHGRRQHGTATDLPDLIRPILPRHYLVSRLVSKCTELFKTMSGMCGRALDYDHPPTAIQKGGNAVMCYERCEMCGNRW